MSDNLKIKRNFFLNNNFNESQIVELLSFLRFILYDGDINNLFNVINSNSNENEMEVNIFYIPAINKQLEIRVLKHLHSLCKKSLAKYPTTFDQDQYIYNNKDNNNISFNYRNCLLLLMNEKTVLAYYMYFCEYCLDLFKLKTQKDIITKVTNDYKNNDCQFDFYIQEVILELVKNENSYNLCSD